MHLISMVIVVMESCHPSLTGRKINTCLPGESLRGLVGCPAQSRLALLNLSIIDVWKQIIICCVLRWEGVVLCLVKIF